MVPDLKRIRCNLLWIPQAQVLPLTADLKRIAIDCEFDEDRKVQLIADSMAIDCEFDEDRKVGQGLDKGCI